MIKIFCLRMERRRSQKSQMRANVSEQSVVLDSGARVPESEVAVHRQWKRERKLNILMLNPNDRALFFYLVSYFRWTLVWWGPWWALQLTWVNFFKSKFILKFFGFSLDLSFCLILKNNFLAIWKYILSTSVWEWSHFFVYIFHKRLRRFF